MIVYNILIRINEYSIQLYIRLNHNILVEACSEELVKFPLQYIQ